MKSMFFCLLAILLASCNGNQQPDPTPDPPDGTPTDELFVPDVAGQQLSAWQKGILDIHFINTTTGECTFIIFPDGT